MPETSQEASGLSDEIGNSLATVWKNHCGGQRPTQPQIELGADFVRCVVADAVADFDAAMGGDQETSDRPSTPATYRLDAISAVGRVTRRRVMAFVSDHDAKTDVATELFILDRPLRRPRADFPDHRRAAGTPRAD